MKKIYNGTLHLAGYENHLYGICANCQCIVHIAMLGPEWNIFYNEETEEYEEEDPATLLKMDLCMDYLEAYNFELLDMKPIPEFEKIHLACYCYEHQ